MAAGSQPRPLRVIQWGAGTVGTHAIRAILAHRELELAGAWVHSAEKAGMDAGELVGLGPCGITVTSDREAILALEADCVFYAGRAQRGIEPILDDICSLLRSGKNVVSTALSPLIYPRSLGEAVVAQLEEACEAGNASFHGTGIEPGWAAEVVPLTLSGLAGRIDSITVQEILDYSTYDNAEMLFGWMGFGRDAGEPSLFDTGEFVVASFKAPLMLLAAGLGATIETFTYYHRSAIADRTFSIPAGEIRQGTIAGRWFGVTAIVDGRPALTIEHITRLGADQAPAWPQGRGYRFRVEGAPSMLVEATIGIDGEDENDQACLATAMHAIHAIAPLCAAPAGIRTFLDLPIIAGRGALGRVR